MMLGKITNAETRIRRDQSRCRFELIREQLQHRRLTRTVWTYYTNARVKLDIQIDVIKEYVIFGIAKRDVGHLHNWWR